MSDSTVPTDLRALLRLHAPPPPQPSPVPKRYTSAELVAQLLEYNRKFKRIQGDGDCMFNAVLWAIRDLGNNLVEQGGGAPSARFSEVVNNPDIDADALRRMVNAEAINILLRNGPIAEELRSPMAAMYAESVIPLGSNHEPIPLDEWIVHYMQQNNVHGAFDDDLFDLMFPIICSIFRIRIFIVQYKRDYLPTISMPLGTNLDEPNDFLTIYIVKQRGLSHYNSTTLIRLGPSQAAAPSGGSGPPSSGGSGPTSSEGSGPPSSGGSGPTSSGGSDPAASSTSAAPSPSSSSGTKRRMTPAQHYEKHSSVPVDERRILVPSEGSCGVWAIIFSLFADVASSEESFSRRYDRIQQYSVRRMNADRVAINSWPTIPALPAPSDSSMSVRLFITDYVATQQPNRLKQTSETAPADALAVKFLNELALWFRRILVAYYERYNEMLPQLYRRESASDLNVLLQPGTWLTEDDIVVIGMILQIEITIRGFVYQPAIQAASHAGRFRVAGVQPLSIVLHHLHVGATAPFVKFQSEPFAYNHFEGTVRSPSLLRVYLLFMLVMAAADALGVTAEGWLTRAIEGVEIKTVGEILKEQRLSSDDPWPRRLVGGYTHHDSHYCWPPGVPTDDTQMALAIFAMWAEDLHNSQFYLNLAHRFIDWMNGTGHYRPVGPSKDVGASTRAALMQLDTRALLFRPGRCDLQLVVPRNPAAKIDQQRARIVWGDGESEPQSNGALMRNTAAVLVTLHLDLAGAITHTVNHTLITHHSPTVVVCCIIHTLMTRHLMQPLIDARSPFPQLNDLVGNSIGCSSASGVSLAATPTCDFDYHRDFAALIVKFTSILRSWILSTASSLADAVDGSGMSAAWLKMLKPDELMAAWNSVTARLQQSHTLDIFGRSYQADSGHCVLSLQIAFFMLRVSTLSLDDVFPFVTVPDWDPEDMWILQCRGINTLLIIAAIGADADTDAAIAAPFIAARFPDQAASSNLLRQIRPRDQRDIVETVRRFDAEVSAAVTSAPPPSSSSPSLSSSPIDGPTTGQSRLEAADSVAPRDRTAAEWHEWFKLVADAAHLAVEQGDAALAKASQITLDAAFAQSIQFSEGELIIESESRPALAFIAAIGDRQRPMHAVGRLIDQIGATPNTAAMGLLYGELNDFKDRVTRLNLELLEQQDGLRFIIVRNIRAVMEWCKLASYAGSSSRNSDDHPMDESDSPSVSLDEASRSSEPAASSASSASSTAIGSSRKPSPPSSSTRSRSQHDFTVLVPIVDHLGAACETHFVKINTNLIFSPDHYNEDVVDWTLANPLGYRWFHSAAVCKELNARKKSQLATL